MTLKDEIKLKLGIARRGDILREREISEVRSEGRRAYVMNYKCRDTSEIVQI